MGSAPAATPKVGYDVAAEAHLIGSEPIFPIRRRVALPPDGPCWAGPTAGLRPIPHGTKRLEPSNGSSAGSGGPISGEIGRRNLGYILARSKAKLTLYACRVRSGTAVAA